MDIYELSDLLLQLGHFREWISKPDHSTLAQVIWKLICGCVKLGYFDMSMVRIFQEPLSNLEVVVLKTLVFFVKSKFVLLVYNREREMHKSWSEELLEDCKKAVSITYSVVSF